MKNLIAFALVIFGAGAAHALPPALYICHSPMNIDAQWDVRVSWDSSEKTYQAQLLNPRVGIAVAKPRGAPINVTQRADTSPGVVFFQGRNFTAGINLNTSGSTIVQGRGKVTGVRGILNGTLPDSGNSKASFNSVIVVCEVIKAMH
ncbi:MAG: hypothetical protein ABL958_08000 [Bdellovibrionia bacterium]